MEETMSRDTNTRFLEVDYIPFSGTSPYQVGDTYFGFGAPNGKECFEMLAIIGVSNVFNLTMQHELNHEEQQKFAEEFGIKRYSVPVKDFSIPTIEQIEETYALVKPLVDAGYKVGFHCGKGYGRTAVMIASMLIKDGYSSDDAIRLVRTSQPHAFVTLEQELFVMNFK